MLFLRPHRRLRKLKRYRQILTRLVFYGFAEGLAEVTERFGLGRRGRGAARSVRHLPIGARLRLLFEDLGPTFIKLGQILSLRSDLLPEEVTAELRRLQYAAAPLGFELLVPVLEEALGPDWRDRFLSIDPQPVASASIAQVHRAVTRDGRTAALKIQRPGIEAVIQADLAILTDLAALMERTLPRTRIYRPVLLIDQFARVISLELDFNYEGRTMDQVRRSFQGDPAIRVPGVIWELTTERLLAMEYVEGIRLADEAALASAGVDTRRVAAVGARYVLTQVFEHGLYNADPHPANFIVRPDGTLAPIDFGMVGLLDEELKQALVAVLLSFVRREPDRLMRVFSELELLGEASARRRAELSQDLSRLIHYYHGMPIGQLAVGRMLQDLSEVVRRHRIVLPVDLAFTFKVIITVESLGRRLDPAFDLVQVARPFVERVQAGRLRDWLDRDRLLDSLEDTGRLLRALPAGSHEILRKLRAGKLKLMLDMEDLDERFREIDRSVNRLAFAVVIAGLLVGSAMFLQGAPLPLLFGLPLLGLFGFGAAAVLGIWFLVGILRSGRL